MVVVVGGGWGVGKGEGEGGWGKGRGKGGEERGGQSRLGGVISHNTNYENLGGEKRRKKIAKRPGGTYFHSWR